ncbi:MAG TPA: hypothetical protein VFZ91_06145 [Allosphingosinicella sp.]
MREVVWLPFVACLLLAAPPAAGGCLPADKVVERMDRYFAAPRSAATYRALAGLGDPVIEPFGHGYYGQESMFQNGAQWEEVDGLRKRMLPVERVDYGGGSSFEHVEQGDCRTGYAIHVAQARIAALGAGHPYVRQWLAVQRAVFSACSSREQPKVAALPAPLALADPALARLQRDDRAYQAAAQLFYRKSPAAPAAFRRIAASRSGHAPIARYMMLVIKAEWRSPAPPPPEPRGETEAEKRVPAIVYGGFSPVAGTRPVPVDEILAEARRILADPRLATIHPITQGLVGSLGYNSDRDYRDLGLRPHAAAIRREQVRLTLEALHAPLERLRTDAVARERYARALDDIDKLHGEYPDPSWWLTGAVPDDAFASRAMAAAARTDRLAAWVLAPKSPYEVGRWSRAAEPPDPHGRWDQFLRSTGDGSDAAAWDVVAHSVRDYYAEAGWPDEAVAETLRCPADAGLAALPTRFYHQVRTALMGGAYRSPPEGAFAAALAHLEAWPWQDSAHYRATVAASLRYLIAAGRIGDARKLRDRLVLKAEDGSYDMPLLLLAEDEGRFAWQLAAHASPARPALLNRLSVRALARLATRDEVPAEERARFARVAWTRLYAMGKPVPAALDRLMRRLNPEITAGWRSRPGRGARKNDRDLLLDVLRSPALNILIVQHQRTPVRPYSDRDTGLTGLDRYQHSDNNWWCAWQVDRHAAKLDELLHWEFFGSGDTYRARYYRADPLEVAGARPTLAPLLASSYAWKAHSAAEEAALSRVDCAPRLLAERAIAWPKPRRGQDEALALAVRATRYGCQRQGGHGAYSRAAFSLLHRRFPDSTAAKRTPYWFDCAHFSGGCPLPPVDFE